jgi:hypothetical protein
MPGWEIRIRRSRGSIGRLANAPTSWRFTCQRTRLEGLRADPRFAALKASVSLSDVSRSLFLSVRVGGAQSRWQLHQFLAVGMRTGYAVYFDMRDLLNARSDVRAGYLKTYGQEWRCATHAVQHLKASAPHHDRLGLVGTRRSLLDDSYGDAISVRVRPPSSDRPDRHPRQERWHS